MTLPLEKDQLVPKLNKKLFKLVNMNQQIYQDPWKEIVYYNLSTSKIKSENKFSGTQVHIYQVKVYKIFMELGFAMALLQIMDFSMIPLQEMQKFLNKTMKRSNNKSRNSPKKSNLMKEFCLQKLKPSKCLPIILSKHN